MLLFAEQGCLQKLTLQVCVLCVRPTGLFIPLFAALELKCLLEVYVHIFPLSLNVQAC